MLSLFRQVRRQLSRENKFSSYLIYALGEILLIVLGILIALQINNWNTARNNRQKIRAIYQEILEDLKDDIQEANKLIHFYEAKDSLSQKVLKNEVRAEDYQKNPNYSKLILNRRPLNINRNGFENLLINIDKIPEQQKPLLLRLKNLYSGDTPLLEDLQQKIKELNSSFLEAYALKYDWFSLSEDDHRQEWQQYQVNNPLYKNEVKIYRIFAVDNLLSFLNQYYFKAIVCYRELYKVLDKKDPFPDEIDHYVFADRQDFSKYLGKYQKVGTSEVKEVQLRDDHLMAEDYSIFMTGPRQFQGEDSRKIIFKFDESQKGAIAGFSIFIYGQKTEKWLKVKK